MRGNMIELNWVTYGIRKDAVRAKVSGGLGFAAMKLKQEFGFSGWHDENLYAVGTMDLSDVDRLDDFWRRRGLVPTAVIEGHEVANDRFVIDPLHGLLEPCAWIAIRGRRAWLAGSGCDCDLPGCRSEGLHHETGRIC